MIIILQEYVEIDYILDDWNLEDLEQEIYKLPPHRKCANHLLNLVATTDAKVAQKTQGMSKHFRSTFTKLQALFNKQSRTCLVAEEVQKLFGRLYNVYPEIDVLYFCYRYYRCSVRDSECYQMEFYVRRSATYQKPH